MEDTAVLFSEALSIRARRTLTATGIITFGQLRALNMGWYECQKGVGYITLSEVKHFLEKNLDPVHTAYERGVRDCMEIMLDTDKMWVKLHKLLEGK